MSGTDAGHSAEPWLAMCSPLISGKSCGRIRGDAAGALRHYMREQGLSGLAKEALDCDRLFVDERAASGIRADWASAVRHSQLLDADCRQIGALAGAAQRYPTPLAEPIVMKGAAVAARYGDPSLRTYADVDLLVPPDEIRAWSRLLATIGYWAPEPEIRAVERRQREGVALTRRSDGVELACDLHSTVFVERRARTIVYDVLLPHAVPSRFAGLMQCTEGAQLVVLALHLAHHGADDHRLVWYRDFVELGEPSAISAARAFAEEREVGWALERALARVEATIGATLWDARPTDDASFNLASAHQQGQTEYLHHLALFRDLGVMPALDYISSRLDPRRFTTRTGSFDRIEAWRWVRATVLRMSRTPWKALWRRGPRQRR